jgi:tRNA G37 N-methylase Trm5
MFTGVGPFALHIATRRAAHVYAIDINPDAISLLERSVAINHIVGRITPVVADAGLYVPANFLRSADRVIMNHPKGASEYIALACTAVTAGGTVHYYDFSGGPNPEESFRKKVEQLVQRSERSVREIESIRRVRDSAPREFQMVADIVID